MGVLEAFDHNAIMSSYEQYLNSSRDSFEGEEEIPGGREIAEFYLYDVYVTKKLSERADDKILLNSKLFLDDESWVYMFYIFAQFHPSLELFAEHLKDAPEILTSDGCTVLHALCSSGNKNEQKIRHVLELGTVDVNRRNGFRRTCVYYLRGFYLPLLLPHLKEYSIYDIVDYAYDHVRTTFYVPEFANEIGELAIYFNDNPVLHNLVLPFVDDKIDICLQMALIQEREKDLKWFCCMQKYCFSEKIPTYETARHELNEWLSNFLIKTDSPYYEYFLCNNAATSPSYLLRYMDLVTQNSDVQHRTLNQFCKIVGYQMKRLSLRRKERMVVTLMNALERNPENGGILRLLAHWLMFIYEYCASDVLQKALERAKGDGNNTLLHVLVTIKRQESIAFVKFCKKHFDVDFETVNDLGESVKHLAKKHNFKI